MPDPIRNPEQAPGPEGSVRNQTTKPPGILPKNAQNWVIAGLATVIWWQRLRFRAMARKAKRPRRRPGRRP